MIPRTNSENINTTNVDLYVIPHKRPYIAPQKRTEKEQKTFESINSLFKKMSQA